MLACGVAPRRSQVATGNTYTSCYGHRFIRFCNRYLSAFAAAEAVANTRGSPAPYALKCATPQLRARLRLRLQNCSAYCKGYNKRLRRPCKCSAILRFALVSPAHFFTRGAPSGRGSRRRFASPRGCAFHTPPASIGRCFATGCVMR